MISLGAAIAVAIVALGLVVTPGPNMMYLVSRSLVQGRAAGLISLAGVVTGFVVYLAATAAGLSLLFAAVPALFTTVKVLGACYLLWLAWSVLRGGKDAFAPDADLPRHHTRRLYLMGLATCLLNPKIALMYGALLPQFVRPEAGSPGLQLFELGLVQIAVATVVNAIWVLVAGRLAGWIRSNDRAERAVRWTTGGLLSYFAVHLGLARAHP